MSTSRRFLCGASTKGIIMACSTSEKSCLSRNVQLNLKCVWSIDQLPKPNYEAEYSLQYNLIWEENKTLYFRMHQDSEKFYVSVHFNGLLKSKVGMVYSFCYSDRTLTEPVYFEIQPKKPSHILSDDQNSTVIDTGYQFFTAKNTTFTNKIFPRKPTLVTYMYPLEPNKLPKINISEALECSSSKTKRGASVMNDLSKDIGSLFENEKFSDVTIIVGEMSIPAHKNILTARSSVFDAMFSHDMKENMENIVTIGDASPQVVHEFLKYVYTSSCNLEENARALLLLAEKYAINSLKQECGFFLSHEINIDNITDILMLAYKTNADILKTEVMKFVKANATSVLQKEDFKNAMFQHPDLSYQVLTFVTS